MTPTERRRRESRDAWLRDIAMIVLTLLTLAVAQIVLLLRTLPVQLPDPPAPKPPAITSRHHF